jgi:hypothetical protein
MRTYNPKTVNRKVVSNRMTGSGFGSFILGNTLGGLQEADNQPSALSGNGLGMGMMLPMRTAVMQKSQPSGMGLSSINKKLESLMVKASKAKPKNIRFNM